MLKLSKYVLIDVLRSRFLLAFVTLLLATGICLFYFQGDIRRSMNSLMSIVMFVIPLVTIVFATTHLYNSAEFIELMVSQPIKRRNIILAEFIGISTAMCTAIIIGIGIPVILFSFDSTGWTLILTSLSMGLVFSSLATLAVMLSRDKAKGIGLALLIWIYFTIIYDGIILAIMFAFSEYPLEKLVVFLTALNPIDLGRIIILLKLDLSALMGYTGALFRDFFGSPIGMVMVTTLLFCWVLAPILFAVRIFSRKNL